MKRYRFCIVVFFVCGFDRLRLIYCVCREQGTRYEVIFWYDTAGIIDGKFTIVLRVSARLLLVAFAVVIRA